MQDPEAENSSTSEPFPPSVSSYVPSKSESSEMVSIISENIPVSEASVTNTKEIPNAEASTSSRKRLRNPEKWIRNVRKEARNSGKSYTTNKGKTVSAKIFKEFDCKCKGKCHNSFSLEQRKKIFKKYYGLANFDLQTSYLCELIKVKPKARVYTKNPNSIRNNTRFYYLKNHNGIEIQVCKDFFLKSLGVSNGRVTRAVKGIEKGSPPHKDQRGKGTPANKTSAAKIEEVETFIKNFPTYLSHYGREKAGDRKYLSPDLNMTIIYNLYKNELITKIPDFVPVSLLMFRKVFNEKFNLHFHPPVTDSCRKCDAFEVKIKHEQNVVELKKFEFERELHQRKAELARYGMKKDAEEGKNNSNNVTVIAFDLMKTLATPVLSTGICYYKRQLWTYCLGIHNLSSNNGYMYVWDETIASRGAQEVASCLIHYIKTYVKTSSLIMYSDQCGGQNRSIKMYAFCNYMVSSPLFTVNKIDHKFLVSDHSYLPCDEDFGLIEKRKKFHPSVFVPDDWVNVIREARKKNPFIIYQMKSEDFFSSKQLEERITNRKTNDEKFKVEWLKIQWIKVSSSDKDIMFFKYSNNDETHFYNVNLGKRQKMELKEPLNKLFPTGRLIDKLKLKDLTSLLPYIPPVHHNFYKNLKSSDRTQDLGPLGPFNNDLEDQS